MDYQSFQPSGQEQNITQQAPPMLEPPRRHFINKKFLVTLATLVVLGGIAYAGIWYWENSSITFESVDNVNGGLGSNNQDLGFEWYSPIVGLKSGDVLKVQSSSSKDFSTCVYTADLNNNNYCQASWASDSPTLLNYTKESFRFSFRIPLSEFLKGRRISSVIVPTFTPRADETVGWETYSTESFSIKYPSNLKLEETTDKKILSQSDRVSDARIIFRDNAELRIEVLGGNSSYPPEDIIKRYFNNDPTQYKRFGIDGRDAIQDAFVGAGADVGNGDFFVTRIFIPPNEIDISCVGADLRTQDNQDLKLCNQILSTFKFTNSATGQFCGGIAGVQCQGGYTCKLDGSYPDAGGTCVKISSGFCGPNKPACPNGYTCFVDYPDGSGTCVFGQ